MESKMKEIENLQNIFQKISQDCNSEGGIVSPADSSSLSGSLDCSSKLMGKIELLQDRWDALSQILEAQSQRVSQVLVLINFLIRMNFCVFCVK